MTFGQATDALKLGQRAARDGWNGKGMYIYLERLQRVHDGAVTEFEPCVVMFDGVQRPGWVPSQADMLAEDWQVDPLGG